MNEIELLSKSTDLVTLSQSQIKIIKDRFPEFKRGTFLVGHSTSQASYSLQTLQMISDSPLSRMKQCLAQINSKYNALQEAYFKIEKKKLLIETLSKKHDKMSRLQAEQHRSEIGIILPSMENAMREIGMFQDMYDSIRKNNNIPENWTEKDFEAQEIENMIRASFRLGIQDIHSNGKPSQAAIEYWEQLGIHPQLAANITATYLEQTARKIIDGDEPSITEMHDFLDSMASKFKDSYRKALARIGLDELGSQRFMAKGFTKPK